MNVKTFGVQVMECMCAQIRPRFILSPKRMLGEWSQKPMLTPREKMLSTRGPEEGRTHDAANIPPTEIFWPHQTGKQSEHEQLVYNLAVEMY